MHTKVEITCPIHGTWSTTPDKHLQGRGCAGCAETGFNPSKPAILYYLSINNGQAYKIGITNKTVEERFYALDLENITILQTWEYSDGAECRNAEYKILQDYKQFKYTGPSLLSSGNTELFSIDILNLDQTQTQTQISYHLKDPT